VLHRWGSSNNQQHSRAAAAVDASFGVQGVLQSGSRLKSRAAGAHSNKSQGRGTRLIASGRAMGLKQQQQQVLLLQQQQQW